MAKELTPQMEELLREFSRNAGLSSKFYFTGGTALAYYYLHHRISIGSKMLKKTHNPPDSHTTLLRMTNN